MSWFRQQITGFPVTLVTGRDVGTDAGEAERSAGSECSEDKPYGALARVVAGELGELTPPGCVVEVEPTGLTAGAEAGRKERN